MNYIEELSLELDKLKNGDFVKVNIHLNIHGALLDLCNRINNEIRNTGYSFIDFSEKNIIVPHVSLFMGYINSFEQFEMILKIAHDFSVTTEKFRIDPTRVHLKDTAFTSSKYILMDLLQNEEIHQQKQYFENLLKGKIKPMEWDFLNESPHITLGCFDKKPKKIEKVLNKYYEFPYCQIRDIGISISGKKGVCLANLKTFDLN